ncbi:MAG TPA: GFA family protein [Pararobbsia sp.]|nr:GFA family protein [Pararobbsia sp.]
MKLTGGCFCGHIRYEIDGTPFLPNICHCVDCRRVAGAPMVAWFSVRPAELRYVKGTPRTFASSAKAHRAFCPDCGTGLTYQDNAKRDEIDVSTCTLDDPETVPPTEHVWTQQRLGWVQLSDDLPSRG